MANTIALPPILSDNVVLQADRPATIWGTAAPRERIRIELAGRRVETIADRVGEFSASLRIGAAGGPHRLRLSGHGEHVVDNVLIGDVWLGSGQSNMEWWVRDSRDGAEAMAAALFPRIRLFQVDAAADKLPRREVAGRWVECDPQTVRAFPAVAYFFGREVHLRTGRPIGLIGSCWGGTRIEPWIDLESLRGWRGFARMARAHRRALTGPAREGDRGFHRDTGNRGFGLGWAGERASDRGWKRTRAPGLWNRQGLDLVGAVWFRREVTVPRSWRGRDLRLNLGPLVDFDETYVNGVRVGGHAHGNPGAWNIPRRYLVPGELVKPGRNCIAVRVFAHGVNGGFAGSPEQLSLAIVNDARARAIPLTGAWRRRVERALPAIGEPSRGGVPGTIFNAMIAPLGRFTLRGVLWYQGESNVGEAHEYAELLELLIRSWRRHWRNESLPFLVCQLADYPRNLADDNLARLREAQLEVAQRVPGTGLAVTLDLGESDIHPRDKRTVGERLALIALARCYGRRVACSGPTLRAATVEGSRMRLRFDHAHGGLAARDGGAPGDFAVAGDDRAFVPARATIDGDSVVISSPRVKRPVAARYAWADAPRTTLINRAGLPASPFRTDCW